MTAAADLVGRAPSRPSGASWLHRASPRAKLIGLLGFVAVVVATPREWVPAFGVYGGIVAAALVTARVRASQVLGRMSVEIPFMVFAVMLPFIAEGPRVTVLGVPLAIEGLWGAWGLLAKATLGLLAAVVLIETTEPRRILLALESLHLPKQLVEIMAFMLRYLDLIVDESHRMHVARVSRGFEARRIASWHVLGRGVAALFVRSHARGERVHLAMLARGHGPR